MVVLIISVIVILVAGFFALVKPTYSKLVQHQNTYETTKTEWDGIKQKLDAIPTLKTTITDIYNGAKDDAKLFVNDEAFGDTNETFTSDRINYAIDQYIQPALDESNLKVDNLAIGSAGSIGVDYYFYTPNVVTYALLEAADINGNYAQTINEELKTSTLIQERQVAEMLGQNISLSVSGTRENLMTFLDAIKSDEHAVIVESLDISDYQFNGGIEGEQVVEVRSVDEAGNEVVTQQVVGANGEPGTGTSGYLISVTFYNAKAVDVPDFGD